MIISFQVLLERGGNLQIQSWTMAFKRYHETSFWCLRHTIPFTGRTNYSHFRVRQRMRNG